MDFIYAGREFNNEIVDQLFDITGCQHKISAVYHPQSNSAIN